MHCDVSAPARAPFLQTPEALIDNTEISDSAFRLLQAMVKVPPRNARNSDAVARGLGMGKEKTNAARKSLRALGHWHARKRRNLRGELREQRLASLTPLRNDAEIAAGWAAAEEAARLGKDTAESRRLGVRLLNSVAWYPKPAAGSPAPRPTRPRPQGDQREKTDQTPLPVPTPDAMAEPEPEPAPEVEPESGPVAKPAPDPAPGLNPLTGPLAPCAQRAETVLLRLRRTHPQLTLAVPDAHELAQIAGHYLLRDEGPETIRAVIAHGLPPEGIRSPKGFVRARLLRFLPPLPAWPREPAAPPRPVRPEPIPTAPDVPLCRPDGPAALVRQGHGWRTAFQAATGMAQQGGGDQPRTEEGSPELGRFPQ